MSLNRYEQLLHDYIESLPEERRYWLDKVREISSGHVRREVAVLSLNADLWDYFEERSRNEPAFSELASLDSGKVSMINLSEYLLRMWAPPKPVKKQNLA